MTLHRYEIEEISNLMTILDDVFPPEERRRDFPDELQTLDVMFIFEHGVVFLDDDDLFAYLAITDANTDQVEAMMSPKHREVIRTDDPKLANIITKIFSVASRLPADQGVRSIVADLGNTENRVVERIVEMTAPRNWPVVGLLTGITR